MSNKVLVVSLAILSAVGGLALYQMRPASQTEPTAVGPATVASMLPEPAPDTTGSNGLVFDFLDEPRALPEVRFVDDDGRALTLSDFQGQLVLLNIWATWCGPCREEMPTLDRLQAAMGGQGFQVVALSIDNGGPEVVQDFYEELGLKALEVYLDETLRATVDLDVKGVPATLLIDQQGRELGRVLGPAEWDGEDVKTTIRDYLAP